MDNQKRLEELAKGIDEALELEPDERDKRLQELDIFSMGQARRIKSLVAEFQDQEEKDDE